ncbi:hypothetical protein L484_013355 [Morus notabilis]|uniref:Uncharacterized protein n=1 Tax=Morus notabilis TaxID=981085 RepID=W9RXN9_9ROSA|nr:uncharacterized protein LOC21396529 [Morus notabilis]EXC16774.1 hypothetical protein L484_013355 [Morus notabilis]
MPFPMKIQPLDTDSETAREPVRADSAKPMLKSRFRRLFDRQFPSVLKNSSAEKPEPPQYAAAATATAVANSFKDGGTVAEFEPSSVCLAKMVQNFMEESNNERQPAPPAKCGRNRCNCFNANSNDSSDDEFDVFGGFGDSLTSGSFGGDTSDLLKTLISCASVAERNLLADTAKIVEKNKIHKRKDDLIKIVTEGLSSLGYDSSICKSKCSSFPAGEYEYIDVIVQGERLLIDIDFRSEFEVARSTGAYKAILQSLPYIFVGKPDRLGQIVAVVSEGAKQSLKKKGMHFPPWRKAEYMRAKWLSPHTRASQPPQNDVAAASEQPKSDGDGDSQSDCGELDLIFGEKSSPTSENNSGDGGGGEPSSELVPTWQPPAVNPKSGERGAKIVTGLASLLKKKP